MKTALTRMGSPLKDMVGLDIIDSEALTNSEIAKTINENTRKNIEMGNFNAKVSK